MGEMMRRSSVAAAAVLVLAACGGGDAGEDPPAGTDTSAATQPATPATPSTATDVELPEGVTPEMVAQGEQIFNQQICMTCHGPNGTGTPAGPALNDQEWLNIDGSYESIVENIRTGVPTPKQYPAPMPPMGGLQLSEDQIRAAAAYVYSISRGG